MKRVRSPAPSGLMCRFATRAARASSAASAFCWLPPSATARVYSALPNWVRSFLVRRLRMESATATIATTTTTATATIMIICVVLRAARFITCLLSSCDACCECEYDCDYWTARRCGAELWFFDEFFYLGDFLLDFAGYVFDDAVGFEVGIVD